MHTSGNSSYSSLDSGTGEAGTPGDGGRRFLMDASRATVEPRPRSVGPNSIRASRHCAGSSPESKRSSEMLMPVVPVSMMATIGRDALMTSPLTTSRCTLTAYAATGAPRLRRSSSLRASSEGGMSGTRESSIRRFTKSKRSDAMSVCSSSVGLMRGKRRLASPRNTAPPPPLSTSLRTMPKTAFGTFALSGSGLGETASVRSATNRCCSSTRACTKRKSPRRHSTPTSEPP